MYTYYESEDKMKKYRITFHRADNWVIDEIAVFTWEIKNNCFYCDTIAHEKRYYPLESFCYFSVSENI